MTDIRCHLDYETRSKARLDLVGAIEYAKHESTSIFCAGYKINDGPLKIWVPERGPMPADLWEAFRHGTMVAFNAGFERAITAHTLPRYTDALTHEQQEWLANMPINRWRCTAAKAAAYALPRSLEMGAKIMGLPTQKDMVGSKLIKKYCKPRKPSKKNPSEWWTDKNDLKRIREYCKIDVQAEYELDEALPDLSDYEQSVWELDQKINGRGIMIDIPTVKLILKMIAEEMHNVRAGVQKLSGGAVMSGTEVAKVLKWCNARGAEMENLRAETIRDKLLEKDLSPKVRLMLEYRQASGKTSTGKYIAMIHGTGDDHRARELLLYNGAIPTGRWAGKRLQPHNFPRPTVKNFNSDEAIEIIKRAGLPGIRKKYGAAKVMDVLVSVTRGMIVASPGHELFCTDFSSVEARLAFWVAEHEAGIEAFRNNAKLYEMMAAEAFDMEVEDVAKDSLERFVGKESVLGCFEAATPVLTQRGWVPIINITTDDVVWDGVEWVNHTGVKFQGHKRTLRLAGIGVTPEHLILTQKGWAQACQVQDDSQHFQSAIGLARLGLEVTDWGNAVASSRILYHAHAMLSASIHAIPTICKQEKQSGADNAVIKEVVSTPKNTGPMQTSSLMTHIGQDCSTAYRQQFKDATTQKHLTSTTMVAGVSKYTGSGVLTEKNFSSTSLHSKGGTSRLLRWIGAMSTKVMSLAISDSSRTEKTCATKGQLHSSKNYYPVYDVTNAGLRNRFTILTEQGPLIVHNCQYGMGWKKFMIQCHKKGMSKVTEEIAKKAVYTYRRVHSPIPELWANLEEAAIGAIQNPGDKYYTNKVVFYVHNNVLNIKLPSGRRLRYHKPSVKQKQLRGGRMVPEIRYWGLVPKINQWMEQAIWGGVFCNHIVQGIARDLMANGMMNIEAAKYKFLLSVHDEGLSERVRGRGNLAEYNRLMTTLPAWAKGSPITSDGWKGTRYKK